MVTETKIETLGDVLAILDRNLASSNEALAHHAKTLVGARTRGSKCDCGLEKLPKSTRVREIKTNPVLSPGCRLFEIEIDPAWDNFNARMGAVQLGEIFGGDSGFKIEVREGAHGLELVTDKSKFEDFDLEPVEISIIVGDYAGEEAIFTWHPGPIMGCLKDGMRWETAVKLV